MPLIRHLLLLVSYVSLATGIVISLPYSTVPISLEACYGLGALVFLMGVALHEGVARRWSDDLIRNQLMTLARAGQIQERDVAALGSQIIQLRDSLSAKSATFGDGEADGGSPRGGLNPAVLTLRNEVETAGELAGKVLRAAPLAAARPAGAGRQPSPLRANREFAPAPIAAEQDAELTPQLVKDSEILALVREAVAEDRIHTVSQPIVSLPQRKVCFREQFTRLRLPNGEALEAGRYVQIAEQDGLIASIDNFQLFRAAQVARETIRRRRQEAVFVNLSRTTMQDREFVSRFIEFLSTNVELAGRVVFEFSYPDLDLVTGPLRAPLDYLAQRGFRFSLDGVEDLGVLNPRKLSARHIRFIKVPADLFIRQADTEIGSVDFGDLRAQLDSSAIDLIVSHIETEQTLLRVLDHRVDFGQGHLFGEPA